MICVSNLWRRRRRGSLYVVVAEISFALWLWYLNIVKFEGLVRTVRTRYSEDQDHHRYNVSFNPSERPTNLTPLANVSGIPMGVVGTVVPQAPQRLRRLQLMKPLSTHAIQDARHKVLKYLNTSTTFRIFRRDINAEDFKFGTNLSTILQHDQTDALPAPVGHRCAVVGNSGILLQSLCGREINDHDFVFRLNLAPVDGEFTRDVGSKIDLITLNRMELLRLAKLSKDLKRGEEGWMYINRLTDVTNNSIVWYPKGFPERLSKIAVSFRDTLHLQPAWAYSPESLMYLASRVWKMPVPSTGLSVMTAALLHCNEVTMYGFFPFPRDSRGRALRYHYYEPDSGPFYSKGNDTVGVHKMPREFALLQKLAEDGAMRLVTERCYDERLDIG